MNRGWRSDSYRHSLAARGIRTSFMPVYVYRKSLNNMHRGDETQNERRKLYGMTPLKSDIYGDEKMEAEYVKKMMSDPDVSEIRWTTPDDMMIAHVTREGDKLKIQGEADALMDDEITRRHDEKEKLAEEDERFGRYAGKEKWRLQYEELEEGDKKENRKAMAYVPTYTGADLAPIAADGVGTAGAAVIPFIPLAVTAGVLYGGAKLGKKAYDSTKGKKKKKKKKAKRRKKSE